MNDFRTWIQVATLIGVLWGIGEIRLIKWQHAKLWKWYEKIHKMNGYTDRLPAD